MPLVPDQFAPLPPQLPQLPTPPLQHSQEPERQEAKPRRRTLKITEKISVDRWDRNPLEMAKHLGILP